MAETTPDGKDVDRTGGAVIDPTKNVLDLVEAEAKKRDEFRIVDAQLIDAKIETLRAEQRVLKAMTDGHQNLQNWMRDSESKRLDQLSGLRETYEKRIADMLSESVRSTSALVSTQLLQIQSTFDARVNKLEEFRLLSTGRSSVSDPALVEAMATFNARSTVNAAAIATLREAIETKHGREIGRGDIIGWIVGAIGLIGILITAFYELRQPTIQPVSQYVPAPTAPITVPTRPNSP
jgi:hypothetical protein